MSKQRINGDLGYLHEEDSWEYCIYRTKHDIVNKWLKRKKSTGKSLRTLNTYSRTAVDFFHHFVPDKHPSEIYVDDIEEWVMEMDERDLSQNSKRRYVESLSSFYDWALKRRKNDIDYNPPGVVLEELERVIRERPETATWDNSRRIIQHISDPRNKAVAVLMAKTGCRSQEALDVKEKHLDFDDGFIRFEDRKGGNTTVNPVDRETMEAIERARVLSGDSDYVFTSRKGGQLGKTQIRRAVKQAAVDAGIMESQDEDRWHDKFVPHYFRTVWTSLMRNYNGAMPDHFVRYLRGDSNQEVMDIYTKQPRDQVREEYLEAIKSLDLY